MSIDLPCPASLPTLKVPPSSSSSSTSVSTDIISSLASAALKHLLFARGQTSQTFAALLKQDEQQRRIEENNDFSPKIVVSRQSQQSRKRQQLLSSLERLDSALLAALKRSPQGDDVPLLVIFGNSPLSPTEIYNISLRLPGSDGEALMSERPPAKALATLERRLVRFLIATPELQDAFAKPLRPTKMHLFALRASNWCCPGWKLRRGFRVDLEVLNRPEAEVQETTVSPGLPTASKVSSDDISRIPSVEVRAVTQRPGDDGHAIAGRPLSSVGALEDLHTLSESLSPLKRRKSRPEVLQGTAAAGVGTGSIGLPAKPVFLRRTSASAIGKTDSLTLAHQAMTPRRKPNLLEPNQKRLNVWASPATPDPGRVLAQKRYASLGTVMNRNFHDNEEVANECGNGHQHPTVLSKGPFQASLRAPLQAPAVAPAPVENKAADEVEAGHGPNAFYDERRRGSRLFPEGSRLLSRCRRGGMDGLARTKKRASKGRRGAKGAAFCLDCRGTASCEAERTKESRESRESKASNQSQHPRAERGFETQSQGGDEEAEVAWFQCEVSVGHLL